MIFQKSACICKYLSTKYQPNNLLGFGWKFVGGMQTFEKNVVAYSKFWYKNRQKASKLVVFFRHVHC